MTTLAGSGGPGFADGPPLTATFREPTFLLALPEGALLVADTGNHAIRKIPLDGGAVTTVAGNGVCDTTDTRSLCQPHGMALGPAGDLYVVSTGTDSVHRIQNGTVTRIIGDGLPDTIVAPTNVAVIAGYLYVNDQNHSQVDIYDLQGNRQSTLFGFGSRINGVTLGYLEAFTASPDGNTVYAVSDSYLYGQALDGGLVAGDPYLVAGNGPGFQDGALADALFFEPIGLTVVGNALYVADRRNNRVRKLDLGAGVVSTLAGSATAGIDDGPATGTSPALLAEPEGIAVVGDTVYFTTPLDGRIRKLENGVVSTLAGAPPAKLVDGCATDIALGAPMGVDIDATSSPVFFTVTLHHAVRAVASNGTVVTLAGGVAGARDGTFAEARFNAPRGLRVRPDGNLLVADTGNGTIRLVDLTKRIVSTLVGAPHGDDFSLGGCDQKVSGPPAQMTLCAPKGVAPGPDGTVYFTDSAEPGNGVLGQLSADGTSVSTLVSDWFFPRGISVTPGPVITLADGNSNEVRQYDGTGTLTATVFGSEACDKGAQWEFSCNVSDGATLGTDALALYFDGSVLRRESMGASTSAVVAGSPFVYGFTDGKFDTLLDGPSALAVGADGAAYIADTRNHRIRKVSP